MALTDLCYLCPECGCDPMAGKGDQAWCTSCGLRVRRTRRGLLLTPAKGEGEPRRCSAREVSQRVERNLIKSIPIEYSARATVSWRVRECPLWHGGTLKGFYETMGPPSRGTITARRDSVSVAAGAARDPAGSWNYLELLALQTSSSSLQISLPGGRLVQLRFAGDSPKRWDDLMRHLVAAAYQRAGRGAVLEFQPRIVAA